MPSLSRFKSANLEHRKYAASHEPAGREEQVATAVQGQCIDPGSVPASIQTKVRFSFHASMHWIVSSKVWSTFPPHDEECMRRGDISSESIPSRRATCKNWTDERLPVPATPRLRATGSAHFAESSALASSIVTWHGPSPKRRTPAPSRVRAGVRRSTRNIR
jgi:hypothetical protein